MSAAIDALNNRMGLRTVAPGDVFTMAVDLELHRIRSDREGTVGRRIVL